MPRVMIPNGIRTATITVMLSCWAVCIAPLRAQEPHRERVFDRVVELQDSLLTAIPAAGRLCDAADVVRKTVSVGGMNLYVEEGGGGPALVLINGGPGGTHHYFHPWFTRAHSFSRVIYYDQRGTGLSDREPGPGGYSVEQATDDLEAMRIALGVDKWVLLGHSYGGFLAQYYAVRYPENVSGLVLVASSTGTWGGPRRGRAYRYLSEAEREKIWSVGTALSEWSEGRALADSDYVALLIYNRFLNGDWKRQYLYRPSPDRIARIALYEWTDQGDFRDEVSATQRLIDFRQVFESSPFPTLIVEGRWDLTWDTDKPAFIHAIHPLADLIVFGTAGHEIFADVPDRFFTALAHFVTNLPDVPASEVARFRQDVDEWDAALRADPEHLLRSVGGDLESSRRIAEAFSPVWLPGFRDPDRFFRNYERVGLALYDTRRYEEALVVFAEMQQAAEEYGVAGRIEAWVPMIWQGHLLDLLGRRDEAIGFYQRAVKLGLTGNWGYSQYGLQYQCTEYASRWLQEPFQRIENTAR